GKLMYYIKWKHFPDSENSWIDETDINGINLISMYWQTLYESYQNTQNKLQNELQNAQKCINDKNNEITLIQNEFQNAQKCINDKNNEIALIQNEIQNLKDRIQNMKRLKNLEIIDMNIDQTMNTSSDNSSENCQQNSKKTIQTPISIRQKELSDSSSDDDTDNKN
ncbi:1276_t:CDS:2, partial [Ambispora gerdemannii]